MGRYLGTADHLTDEQIRAQAAKAGYVEIDANTMERLAFRNNGRQITIYDDNTILG